MSTVFIQSTTLTAIADAIRTKTSKTSNLDPANFASEILSISGGVDIEEYDGTIIIEDNAEEFDFVVYVGDSINLPVDPQNGQDISFSHSGILEGYNDGGVWQVNAIGVGTCTIYINSDADEPDHTFVVKVLESEEPSEPTPTLISFTIDGVSYQAEDGMTWAEWCDSDYDTIGLDAVGDYYVNYGGHQRLATDDNTNVIPSDEIISKASYKFYEAGGAA